MKKVLSVFFVSFIFYSLLTVNSFALVNTRIDDSADLFTESDESVIADTLLEFSLETDYSVIVLTTDNAIGKTSQQFADDYFDNLIISYGWEQEGILFLIDMDNREVCISTMGECIPVYADAVDFIIDCGYDELVDGNYSECITLMVSAALDYSQNSDDDYYGGYYTDDYYGDYPVNDGWYNDDYYYEGSSDSFDFSNVFTCIVIAAVIGAITVFAVKSSYKNMGKGDEFDADDLTLNLTGSNDTVISRNVITTRVPRNNNHNRPGGSSGGGVSHRSSGGFSHGGGSRKF